MGESHLKETEDEGTIEAVPIASYFSIDREVFCPFSDLGLFGVFRESGG